MSALQRWAAGVEYRGTAYSGWQFQAHAPSVQQHVEDAISRVANHPVSVTCAGRTDAGVHALGQVIHFESESPRSDYAWLLGCNSQLPKDIALTWVQPCAFDFHARHSATARSYRYVLRSGRAKTALLADSVAWVFKPLDAQAMHRGAQALIGEHDFSGYRDADCQSPTPMRNVHSIDVRAHAEFTVIDVTANAFLHHMVRNITGVLLAIGQGEKPESWAREVLEGRERAKGGVTAVPGGLYFIGPTYPASFKLPGLPKPWFPGSVS